MNEQTASRVTILGDARPPVTDADLMEDACTDPQAFGTVYDRYVDRVYRYFYHQTGIKEVAEDLTSLTFARALAGLQRFRADQPIAPWLLRIAHNVLVDERRARARGRPAEGGPQGPDDYPAPQEPSGLEQAERFMELTGGLPPAQRDALALHYIADLSMEQTAASLGRSVAATRMLVSRALTALRTRLASRAREGEQ